MPLTNTENFHSVEWECRCGCREDFPIDMEQVHFLEDLRDRLGRPVTITSGYRCEEYNKKVGGAKHSQHRLGTATDIIVRGMDVYELYEIVKPMNPKGLGLYENFLHIDNREGKRARW